MWRTHEMWREWEKSIFEIKFELNGGFMSPFGDLGFSSFFRLFFYSFLLLLLMLALPWMLPKNIHVLRGSILNRQKVGTPNKPWSSSHLSLVSSLLLLLGHNSLWAYFISFWRPQPRGCINFIQLRNLLNYGFRSVLLRLCTPCHLICAIWQSQCVCNLNYNLSFIADIECNYP